MCGIAGFSLPATSKINARKLSKALLCNLDVRGNQASGYAWAIGRQFGMHKQDVPGANLSMRKMPRRVQSAILHTRLATHGSVKINANNHPVLSPNKQVALVHNGVIWNHSIIRPEIGQKLPEVDTAVIPALLEKEGIMSLNKIDGDAAIAWLDDNNAGLLNVARIEHSPLTICQTKNGEFIFASTKEILVRALDKLKMEIEWMLDVDERTLITISNGVITEWDKIPELNPAYEELRSWNTSYYRGLTAGGYKDRYGDLWYDYDTEKASQYGEYKLVDGEWKYVEGNRIVDIDEDEDDEYDPDMWYGVDPATSTIETFDDFKKHFTVQWNNNIMDYLYWSKNGNSYVGNEDDLWDLFEQWRYEQSWQWRDPELKDWSDLKDWD